MDGVLLLTVLVLLYIFAIGYLGYRGYRGTKTATDYLIAGREIHPFVMAMSYGAAFISTSAIVGFGGASAMFGLGILWLPFLNIFVGIFIAFIFIGSRTRAMGRRLDVHTFPEFLGARFQSRFLQVFAALIILFFMPLYAGVVLMGATKFIEVRLNIDYETALLFFSALVAVYVIMGGLKGVMYADAMQGIIMLAGMGILLFLTFSQLGGVVTAQERLTELAPQATAIFGEKGHQGWTAMPRFGSEFWWILVSSITLGVGIGVLAQPQLAVRYMTVKSTRELNRAGVAGGIFILIVTGGAYLVGSLSNVYFFDDPDVAKISFQAANKDLEQIIPLFITRYMPPWLGDVFFVTLMAAAMSTACSQFHAMGSAVGRDLFGASRTASSGRTIGITRIGIIITFLASVGLAYGLPVMFAGTGTAIVARGTAIFFGLCAAAFLPMYIGGLYTRAITKAGAIAGAVTGFGVSAFWLLFIHAKEANALQLCNFIFGRSPLTGTARTGFILWAEVDPIVVALPLAILVTVAVSMMTKDVASDHVARCFGDATPRAAAAAGSGSAPVARV